ncbi:hypothetical protein TorRG33x02_073990 [Trema orientale]|uniref:Uncharacterized protein n=1 Tax=Trema orientale TaxID=63057 RepID=A0A2P5FFW4_TREOI|nr:hypothetical protein TorRG33x02_073990 [Trema orientale]
MIIRTARIEESKFEASFRGDQGSLSPMDSLSLKSHSHFRLLPLFIFFVPTKSRAPRHEVEISTAIDAHSTRPKL